MDTREKPLSFEELFDVRSRKNGAGSGEYLEMRRAFESEHGDIVEEAWPPENGAVVLTRKPLRARTDDVQLYHHTADWLAQRTELSVVERRLTALATKTHDALGGMPRKILLDQIFCELSSFIESVDRRNTSHNKTRIRSANEEIDRLEGLYNEAAARAAQVEYIEAMIVGWVLLMLTGAGIWEIFQLRDVAVTAQLFFAALLAGGLGACISVLIRMSKGRFTVSREPSRSHTWLLGMLRPFIGATFGVVTFFIVTSGMLQVTVPPWSTNREKALAWVFAVAFLSGFAERFATNLFKASEDTVLAASKSQDGKPSEQPEK